jgi:hypothetical protein
MSYILVNIFLIQIPITNATNLPLPLKLQPNELISTQKAIKKRPSGIVTEIINQI